LLPGVDAFMAPIGYLEGYLFNRPHGVQPTST
jgi:hypothetical protein